MATNFPTSADDATTVGGDSLPAAGTALSDSTEGHPSHSDLHENVGDAVQAIEAKVGTGSSTPAANTVLTGTASGTSGWATVSTAMIGDDQVTQAKIGEDAVGADQLAANAVVTTSIVDDQVTQAKIGPGAVGTTELGSDAVNGDKIADDVINSEHIAAGAIDTEHIADGQVTAGKLAEAYYTEAESDARFLGITAKAADSDKLDNLDSTQFLRSDADDTTTGRLTVNTTSVGTAGNQALNIVCPTNSSPTGGISFQYGTGGTVVNHGIFRMSNNNIHRYVFLQEDNASLADVQLQSLYYSGSLTSTSDETLKNNEGPALGLSFVNRLAPFTGTWIDGDGEKHQFLGAQSVEAALTAEGVDAADYGMIGNDSEIGPRTMSYMELVPVLVKAVQELTARLEAVEG